MALADVHNRWNKFNKKQIFFTTGTDEHGLKVQMAASKAGIEPKLFCDGLADKFKDLAQIGNIQYDRFIRTTDPDHALAVSAFWKTVWDKGYIYKGQHSGWYSVSDEAFYPESEIIQSDEKNPKTGDFKMVAIESGSEVTFEVEENYFFKLSSFQDELIEMMESKNQMFIQPKSYHTAILNDLKSTPLQDLSISRPSWRLQWGLPVPGDEDQKIYVWFDALVNYLTSIGYPYKSIEQLPEMVHLIGKDITKFHCVYWPAFLMAAGMQPPQRVIVHGHWLMDGRKMSKSRGNVVDPVELAEKYDSDSLRLFLMRYSVLDSDGDFRESGLKSLRNEFIGKFGNLLIRCLSKNFDICRALNRLETKTFDELLDDVNDDDFETEMKEIRDTVNGLHGIVDENYKNFEMHKAVQSIWAVGPMVNGMFDKQAPWTLKVKDDKSSDVNESNQLKQDLIIFTSLDSLRCVLILLQAIIPNYSKVLLDRLRVDQDRRTAEWVGIGKDLTYGQNSTFKKGEQAPIPRIE
ncbi:hypothetical protein CANARDRAFT_174272 [[Candida] arabinofermentans NRRL YB-2248]|uniref:Methionine--tRNA ligase, mitochondrial n=1 Tax=[Candida] arabinofermentans NRRL YB-2248 TaxID=983967 RepID=A0A1E4T607_9ASCO|nr:hypothetical protein CANARDRAFT_174272 [[Candida] arabinofermentans NRRL YB-2248]